MKVLVYDNKGKDVAGACLNKLIQCLNDFGIEYQVLSDTDLENNYSADALFSLGGDGTILYLTKFANVNKLPIIGINVGKLGFLTDFERSEIEDAVKLFVDGKLIKDGRSTIKLTMFGETYYSLNEVFLNRIYSENISTLITEVKVYLDGNYVGRFNGDGLIVNTPTGSTAYSLSAGGPILAPNSGVFCITPLASHSFNNRPIAFSSSNACVLELTGKTPSGVYVDGKLIGQMNQGDSIEIINAENSTLFYRKESFDFFNRLSKKLGRSGD